MNINYAQHFIDDEEIEAVFELLKDGWLARGPILDQFEDAFTKYIGCSHSISCVNGSASLEIILRALGIGDGDEVIVPNVTWVSTASAVNLTGAVPVLCDISSHLPNLCIHEVETCITPRTKAIIPVHFAGISIDMEAYHQLCQRYGLHLIEDAAHAVGGHYEDGTKIGSSPLSIAASFSFHPAKNMTTGEGGMITTRDKNLAQKLAKIRSNGVIRNANNGIGKAMYDCTEIASNYHLNGLAASLGICQLKRLDEFVSKRQMLWETYAGLLDGIPNINLIPHPQSSAFNLCIITVKKNRDDLLVWLNNEGVGAYYHYPLLSELTVYKDQKKCRFGNDFSNALEYNKTALTLPLHPSLDKEHIEYIVDTIKKWLDQ
ncbi:DegT/DnrJ/EryC1/StrS family aminotransferase [Temperatibacter marinus]|uniref:DegT/DnrJ/EryC1/StrS family aminotransferase n=1 Tax=Temperatibacter marinus TaxID=1456591 RepID=A0AA52H9M0_9PROT|nr:DegT/DnrJ/EryC1/StrS family aminotransferase [Temperatibacter marinus]WND03336.1 DegT/DnrJ/EryC1/StrS family aminotransferase [Temperatibacter marinus]